MNRVVHKPRIAITLGDPAGIGPEITAKALSKSSIAHLADFLLIGDRCVYTHYKKSIGRASSFLDLNTISHCPSPQRLSEKQRGTAAYAYLQKAIALLRAHDIDAVVTAPVNKNVIINAGFPHFTGHTEMFADAFHVTHVEMMFVGGPFKTIIATRHMPLHQVASSITIEGLLATIRLSHACLKKTFKIRRPHIALCGVNPHAGEHGKIGTEEMTCVRPAIEAANNEGMRVDGPLAADTVFIPSHAQKYDLIIAMYHDQGLAPIKALYFNQLVNLTIGLPFIRTSTAHGTAEDIAGLNCADPSSMIAAIRLACQLTPSRRSHHAL